MAGEHQYDGICNNHVTSIHCHILCFCSAVIVTLEEVNSQIALEYGQAMTVRVLKADGEIMPIVVVQNATVLDLKNAICRFMELKQQREGGCNSYCYCKYAVLEKPDLQ
uniref:SNRNP25 ubiquitin-like domain-containing protein n=1 Tax=Sphaeramia orbicularis TaxID=375764 RepID=A0A672YC73_9TELE